MATPEDPKPRSPLFSSVEAWGNSSLPPMAMATLIAALHGRPLTRWSVLPLFGALVHVGAAYASVAGFKIDAAGTTAAWSGVYVAMAYRGVKAPPLLRQFTVKGVCRHAALGVGITNVVACGWVWAVGDRRKEAAERKRANRWGIQTP